MADPREPLIVEDFATLTGTATWPLVNNTGLIHDNTELTGGTIALINPALPGICRLPEFTPPTFVGWLTSVKTETGTATVNIATPHEPTFIELPVNMTTISPRGNSCNLRVNLAAGANSLDGLVMTYSISFCNETDIDEFGYLDDDTILPEQKFSVTAKRSAIRYANARLLFSLKKWESFYNDKLDVQVRKILKEIEAYYALSILYDKKAKQILMMAGGNDTFSVGDMNVNPAEENRKAFYTNYQALSQIYKARGDELLGSVIPPGTDATRAVFYFDMNTGD